MQAVCLILPTQPLSSRFKSPQMLALLCFPGQGFISSTHNSSTWVCDYLKGFSWVKLRNLKGFSGNLVAKRKLFSAAVLSSAEFTSEGLHLCQSSVPKSC